MRRFGLKFLRALGEADFDLRNLNLKVKAKAFFIRRGRGERGKEGTGQSSATKAEPPAIYGEKGEPPYSKMFLWRISSSTTVA